MTSISLSKLHEEGRVKFYAGFDGPFEYCLCILSYHLINGLPFYEVTFTDKDKDDMCSNNAIDIMICLNKEYGLVLIP
jgi:hypothetical protein